MSIVQIRAAWERFFFEPISPAPMALYRICLGGLALANFLLMAPDVMVWFGQHGSLAPETAKMVSGGTGLNILSILPQTDQSVWLLFTIACLAAATLMIGFFTRLSAGVLFLAMTSLDHRNPIILNGGDSFLRLAIFFTIFSQGGAAWSIDRLMAIRQGKEHGPPKAREPWAQRLIAIQVAFVYLYTFIWKAMGTMWLGGTAVYYTSRLSEFWRFPVPYIFEHLWTIKLWTWSTLIIELALGTLVWIKEFRYWVLLSGVLLHLGIDYSMNIPLFAPIMVSAYLTFVEPADLERVLALFRKVWRREGTAQKQAEPPVPKARDKRQMARTAKLQ